MVCFHAKAGRSTSGFLYVTASQSARHRHGGWKTKRAQTLRAGGPAQEAEPMEGRRPDHRLAQNQAGSRECGSAELDVRRMRHAVVSSSSTPGLSAEQRRHSQMQMFDCRNFWRRPGVASRRAGEKIILEGRVAVNGRTVRELGGEGGRRAGPGDGGRRGGAGEAEALRGVEQAARLCVFAAG